MKQRILALLLIAAMSFTVLAACGSKDETPETDTTPSTSAPAEDEPSFGADLAEFYNKIMAAAEEGPFMMDIAAEAEMLEATYPGLKDIETKQLVAYTPAMSAVAIEFAFVEVANASDVEAVKTIFQTRIDAQVNGGAFYPETIEGWQNNSEIVVIDNYVCLFVCAEKDGMIDALRSGTEVPAWAKAQTPAEGEGDSGIMDMPVEDGPAAYDPEGDIPVDGQTPSEPGYATEEPSTPAVKPEPTPEVKPEPTPEATPAPSAPAATIDLNAFYNKLYNDLYPLDAEGFATGPFATDLMDQETSGMTAEDAALMLEMYYPGLKDIKAKQMHVYIPGMSFSAYEVVLMELANAAEMDAVKTILQARIDAQAAGGAWYPEAVEGWVNNARIVTNGSYIMMAVGADCDKFVDAFNALF